MEYLYDGAGNLTKYDYATGTSNDATFHYLPGSWQRYKRVQDTTAEYFVYDGANVLDSYASNGNLNARYVTTGVDENLSMTRGGSAYYYMADGLGSVRNVVNSSETVQNTYDYYAFGNTLGTPTTGVTNPYEYTGREFEDGSVNTTFFYRNRYYMSGLGIFMSRDAMWADIHRGWGYVGNSPSFLSDPWGRDAAIYEALLPGHKTITVQRRNGTWRVYDFHQDRRQGWLHWRTYGNLLGGIVTTVPGEIQTSDLLGQETPWDKVNSWQGRLYTMTPEEDARLAAFLDDLINDPPGYNVEWFNCRHFSDLIGHLIESGAFNDDPCQAKTPLPWVFGGDPHKDSWFNRVGGDSPHWPAVWD